MSEPKPCSALIDGCCKNGFFTSPIYRGHGKAAPMCMDEDWTARMFHRTDGLPPRLYAQRKVAK